MDLTATAVLNLTVYQNKSVIDRIFCLNAVLHNASQFQSLAKFDKFVFNSDFKFFTLLNFLSWIWLTLSNILLSGGN